MASVLIVDDEEGIRSFLSHTLERAGHEVETAGGVDAALGCAKRRRFHVVITDLNMPERGGMELVRQLRKEQPEVEIIVLTAHGSVSSAVEGMKLGAFDYLEKPLESPAELRLIVDRALERQRLHSHREAGRLDPLPPLSYGAPAMDRVVQAIKKVASTDATVLLTGESGTGKEIAARTVHAQSSRREGPFVAVNCAAISETLLESELFGHEKGAFTGAARRRRGRLELADGGTFFLDEVGELKPSLQAKLLRVLQERRFERVGGGQTVEVNVRWIAATNRDLPAMVGAGEFREDLFHRLAVFPIELPPLRERPEDISPLAEALLLGIGRQLGRHELSLDPAARDRLAAAPWPGNVRELANTLERSAILAESPVLRVEDLAFQASAEMASSALPTVEEAERNAIQAALKHFDGNRKKAAEHLGIGLRTLYDKIKKYGL